MDEIARVLKIEGTTITVKGGELDGCVGCMNDSCKTNGSLFIVENKSGLALEPGQLVEVASSRAATAAQAAFVFVPPAAAFAAAYAAVAAAVPSSGDAARAAAGVVALILGFFAVYLFRRIWPSKASPEVVRIVAEEELETGSRNEGSADFDMAESIAP